MNSAPTAPRPAVSVIIVNYHAEDCALKAAASVHGQPWVAEILIIDNGSTSSLLKALQKYPDVALIEPGSNIGFAAAANVGAAAAHAEYLFFLNPDAVAEPGCIDHLMAAYLARPGIIGPTIYAAANHTRDMGATMNHIGMSLSLVNSVQPPLYVSGCALFTSTDLFAQLGGFDDRYFLFVEDTELCWRALIAGYDVRAVREGGVLHEGGVSIPGGYYERGQRYHTSTLRISLRERNTVALMISCAPWYWLPLVLPALLARSLAFAFIGLCLGRMDLTCELLRGVRWNISQLEASLTRRRSIVRCYRGVREASRRFIHRPILLSILLESGLPKVASRGRL